MSLVVVFNEKSREVSSVYECPTPEAAVEKLANIEKITAGSYAVNLNDRLYLLEIFNERTGAITSRYALDSKDAAVEKLEMRRQITPSSYGLRIAVPV